MWWQNSIVGTVATLRAVMSRSCSSISGRKKSYMCSLQRFDRQGGVSQMASCRAGGFQEVKIVAPQKEIAV